MWWQEISSLEGKTAKPPAEYHVIDGEWMTKPEMLEAPNKYFSSADGVRADEQSTCAKLPNSFMPTNYCEVKTMFRKLNTRKASYSEDLPTWVSKECAEDLCVPITNIVNKMLVLSIIQISTSTHKFHDSKRHLTLSIIMSHCQDCRTNHTPQTEICC